jgi:predicted secreted protein
MATQAITGRIGFVAMAGSSTGTLAEIGEVRNYALNVTHREIDATSNDSSGFDEFIDGQKGWELTCEALYARTDAEQKALRQALISGASKYFQLRPSTAVAANWRGHGYVRNFGIQGAHDGAVVANFEMKGTRAVTYST